VNTHTTSFQGFPSVVSDSDGNFVVAWTSYSQDGSKSGVFAQRYANTGEPLGVEFQVNTYTTSRQRTGSVAADSAGNFVVVWTCDDQDGNGRGVFAQRYASTGEPLGEEFEVNSYTYGAHARPSVASDSVGNFVVVWTGYIVNPDGDIFARRYDTIVPLELPSTIE
jgi:hypothetical protein